MNDNRTPSTHRSIAAEQANRQRRGNVRPYRSSHWPQAERLQYEDGGVHMIGAMLDWRAFNASPVTCIANDNYIEPEDTEAGQEQEHRFDNLMTTQSARLTIKLQADGKLWRPSEERFDIPHQNDRARAEPGPGQYKENGVDLYQIEANAEDEVIRAIDCTSVRNRLGHVCCRLLDLASADSTTEEIADAVKQPMSHRMETYIDWSIIRWMRDGAYWDYAA